jgi:hypothetical protein
LLVRISAGAPLGRRGLGRRLFDRALHELGGLGQAQAAQLLDHSDNLLACRYDVLAGMDCLSAWSRSTAPWSRDRSCATLREMQGGRSLQPKAGVADERLVIICELTLAASSAATIRHRRPVKITILASQSTSLVSSLRTARAALDQRAPARASVGRMRSRANGGLTDNYDSLKGWTFLNHSRS